MATPYAGQPKAAATRATSAIKRAGRTGTRVLFYAGLLGRPLTFPILSVSWAIGMLRGVTCVVEMGLWHGLWVFGLVELAWIVKTKKHPLNTRLRCFSGNTT